MIHFIKVWFQFASLWWLMDANQHYFPGLLALARAPTFPSGYVAVKFKRSVSYVVLWTRTLSRHTTWRHFPGAVFSGPWQHPLKQRSWWSWWSPLSHSALAVLSLSHLRDLTDAGTQISFPVRVLLSSPTFWEMAWGDFPSFACGIQLSQHHWLRRQIFPFILAGTLHNTMHIFHDALLFLGSRFYSMTILMPAPTVLMMVVNLGIRSVRPS